MSRPGIWGYALSLSPAGAHYRARPLPASRGLKRALSMVMATTLAFFGVGGLGSASASVSEISNLSFTPLTTAGGATGHWSFSFETSSSGALTGSTVDTGYGSYIQVQAPTGTEFNQVNGCDYVINSTTSDGCAYVAETVSSPPTVDVYLPGSMSIGADQDVSLSIDDVTNPPATTAYSGIEVSTSSDPGAVSANGGPFTAAQSVSNLSFTPLSTAGGATGHWSFSFETSSSGALTGSTVDTGYGSYIQVQAPTGTEFNQVDGCDYVINSTTSDGCAYVAETVSSPPTVDVYLPGSMSIGADQDVSLSIDDVTNPPATTAYSGIEVSTSSDPGLVSANGGPFTAAQSVSGLGFSTGAGLGTATGVGGATVNWTIGFTASSTGALTYSPVNAPYGSYIDIAGPSGATFPSNSCNYQLEDVTTGTTSNEGGVGCPTPEVSGTEVVIYLPENMTIAAGDGVSLTIDGVVNPSAGTSTAGFEFATSSDPSAISPTGAAFSEGASISGQVLDPNNNPVVGAAVQLCSVSTEFCADTDSLSGGTFSAFVPDGTYFASAFPTASEQLGTGEYQGQVTLSGTTAVTGIDITMSSPPSLPSGFSIITAGGATETSSTASPFLYWGSPFELQLSPSIFPSGETVVATQVVVQGTDIQTGDLVQQVVDIGGSVGGLPAGVVVGSQPIDVSMPALAPIHGEVSFSVNYQTYASGTEAPGVISTQVVDLVYPNATPPNPETDPQPAYFTNTGDPGGVDVGGGTITGTDAPDFSVVPLSDVGVPAGTNDCGRQAVSLAQYQGQAGGPGQSNECGVGIQFTPPASATQIFYYATLEEKVGSGGTEVPVSLVGCDEEAAALAAEVTGFDPCNPGGPEPCDQGQSEDSFGTDCGGPDVYVDPSGTVVTEGEGGTTVPVGGASVTLLGSLTPGGPFSPVPNGSVVMSPANRQDPSTTDADGNFGWDVLAGYYEVEASLAGCTSTTTPVETIPPPVTGLQLELTGCTSGVLPTQSTTTTSLKANPSPATVGQPVTLTATVSGSSPTGTVDFQDGATDLGSAVVTGGAASLVLATLPAGDNSLSAAYSGDEDNQPSTSKAITEDVEAPSSTLASSTTSTATAASLGNDASDSATVTGAAGGPAPTGTVSFYACYNATASPTGCNATTDGPVTVSSVNLSSGTTGTSGSAPTVTVSSGGYKVSQAGDYCFFASYSGDGNYSASSDTSTGPECFTVATSSGTNVSLAFSGAITYNNSGPVTSGTLTVKPASGTISSVLGTIRIPGLNGGSAVITVAITRIGNAYIGAISVSDPSANLNTTAGVLTTVLTRTPSGEVSGAATGLYKGRLFNLKFTI